jgi:hypothetical protein
MGPEAIVVTERRHEVPTRRIVYAPRTPGGYERRAQVYRLSIEGWHTTGTEVVAEVVIDR